MLSFAGMQGYTPWEGGGHGFVDQEGYYKVRVESVTPGLAKDGIKGLVKIGVQTAETDKPATPLISRVLYSGADKNNEPLVRQFCDFLHSTGTTIDNIQSWGQQGASMNIEQAVAQLVGREAYVELRFSSYNGRLTTEVANWISVDVYNKAAKNGIGMRGRKAADVNPAQLQGASAAPQAVQLGGPQAAAAPALGGPQGFAAPQAQAPAPQFAAPAGNAQPQAVVQQPGAPAGGTIPNL
jgi:hypothetical protein